ncbi:hypothetical protein [Sorangium sp. So ce1153]|uniref:hypothetical protein n=1 Tax=Sorangium sp. So ce1153 TaxID=3133333 RepID=UPI003F632111
MNLRTLGCVVTLVAICFIAIPQALKRREDFAAVRNVFIERGANCKRKDASMVSNATHNAWGRRIHSRRHLPEVKCIIENITSSNIEGTAQLELSDEQRIKLYSAIDPPLARDLLSLAHEDDGILFARGIVRLADNLTVRGRHDSAALLAGLASAHGYHVKRDALDAEHTMLRGFRNFSDPVDTFLPRIARPIDAIYDTLDTAAPAVDP